MGDGSALRLLGVGVLVGFAGLACWLIYRLRLWRIPPREALTADSRAPGAERLLLIGLGLWMCAQLGAVIAVGAFAAHDAEAQGISLRTMAIGMMGMYLAAGCALAALLWRVRGFGRAIGFQARLGDVFTAAGWLALSMPILLLLGVALMALLSALRGSPPETTAHTALTALSEGVDPWGVLVMVLVVIGAPFVEEVIYRGCVQSAIRRAAGQGARGAWLAITITTVIFAAVHLGTVAWYALPILIGLSIVLGVAYERSGRLSVPILIHAGFNALQLVYTLA